ncbi:MAG: gliding motility-associated C-terminal domain-containing protein, partial [Bacteroidota bacterium]|nr:gliding motility-associated C-terminal domain-containing protein [Bacteroidota bacterium]
SIQVVVNDVSCGDASASAKLTKVSGINYTISNGKNIDTDGNINDLEFNTTYTITATNPVTGCQTSTNFVTTNPIEQPSRPESINQIFCGSAKVGQLKITAYQSGTTIHWYKNNVLQKDSDELTNGVYQLSQSLNGCESARTSIEVTIITKPNKPMVSVSKISCGHTLSKVSITNFETGFLYKLWQNNTERIVTETFTIENGKTYQLKAHTQHCYNESDVFSAKTEFENIEKPIVEVKDASCSESVTTATITNYNSDYQYVITPNGTAVINNNTIVGMVMGQNYTIKAVKGECQSEVSDDFSAKEKRQTPMPLVDRVQTFCSEATIAHLKASGNDIKWYDSQTSIVPLSSKDVLTTKTYYVSQTENQCESNRISVEVKIENCQTTPPNNGNDNPKCELIFYNALSPNGDGLNDIFFIKGIECYPDNTLRIFSSTGVKIYQAKGYDNKNVVFNARTNLDKHGKGRVVPQNAYFYILEYSQNGRNQRLMGWIYIKL